MIKEEPVSTGVGSVEYPIDDWIEGGVGKHKSDAHVLGDFGGVVEVEDEQELTKNNSDNISGPCDDKHHREAQNKFSESLLAVRHEAESRSVLGEGASPNA